MGDPVQPVPRVQIFEDHVIRSRVQADERDLIAAASAAGAAPQFTVIARDQIRMPRHIALTPLIAPATADEKRTLARSLLACIERLHAAGICHRDAHRDNFVLDDRDALLIDFELACRVDPGGPCYDQLGPASGIPVHWRHEWLGMIHGVWWDSPTERVRQLWQDFGPLADLVGPEPGQG